MKDKEEKLILSIAISFYSFMPAILFFFYWLWPVEELKNESQILFYGWIGSFLIGGGCLSRVWFFSTLEEQKSEGIEIMRKRTVGKRLNEYLLSSLTGQEKNINKLILFRLTFIVGVLSLVFLAARC